MKWISLCLAASLLSPLGLRANENPSDVRSVADLEKQHAGSRIGVMAIDPARNKRVESRAEERFLMCSTFKMLAVAAVLKRVDEKKEKLDRFVPYDEAQLLEYAPVTRAHVKEGGMTLEALCAAALKQSDNTAANLLLDIIGGPAGWTQFARMLGDNSTHLDRKEPELNVAGPPGDERDTTTPAAMCADLQRLFTSDVLSPESRTRLEAWMQQNETGLKMIRANVPADWKVGDKTGRSGKGACNDIAIVRPPAGGPIFIAIYVDAPNETSAGLDLLVGEAAKIAIKLLKK